VVKVKRIPVNLKEHQHESLRTLAFKDKNSISDQVRKAIDDYLKKRNIELKDSP
jgi:metal-responsive CopG/Arc/MetJ family transcriptional regulator